MPGLVLVTGANGAGKTNLLEALHVGTQGFSPRVRGESQLLRFGSDSGRVELSGRRGTSPLRIRVDLNTARPKRAWVNGASLRTAEQLRQKVATLVFTPDRLSVIKGGPAVRRAYFDRVLGRLSPMRAALPAEYGAAVAQRNAALRRVAAGVSSRQTLAPWSTQVASLGAELVTGRQEVLEALAPRFDERAAELGLDDAQLRYEGDPLTPAALELRLERDLDRGVTGIGPHLHDAAVTVGSRELRSFGSQGEQRLAVLALLLAEMELLHDRTGVPPLLLLDDVLSELDRERRRILVGRIAGLGQTVVTATDAAFLPGAPAQLLEVRGGEVHAG